VDPEQIYQEVLQEEQQKGSAAPVAEGRAKAARQRAIQGSPHPKEPRWWAGAQPHLDGGGGTAEPQQDAVPEEVPAAPVEDAAPAQAPAAEVPDAAAAQAPANVGGEAPVADVQAPATPPPGAPEEPATSATSSAANQPVPVAAATAAPPDNRPAGVRHGTPTGNRLRPEDGVATEAQFEGQRAMYDRRKLIDELVGTGVPVVTAEEVGRPRAPGLAILYILIPILAIFVVAGQEEPEPVGAAAPAEAPAEGEGAGQVVVAANVAFDVNELTLEANTENLVTLQNQDSQPHNISIYETAEDGLAFADPLFLGETIPGGETIDYTIAGPRPGDYYFQCDVHPNMNGDVTVE